jgi:hypothetical protein
MRFVPYNELTASTPNVIVDGAPGAGTVLTLSHWPKSGTPAQLKRDTSAEIAFAYLDSLSFHVTAEIVSNNHFDEDGLIGMYALVDTVNAQRYREILIDAASAGDFGVFKNRDAARISFTISAYADSEISPLDKTIFKLPHLQMAGQLYTKLLELMPDFLVNLSDYKQFWEAEDEKLSATERLISEGLITIEEQPELDLAIIRIGQRQESSGVHRFAQQHIAQWHPLAIHSRTPRSRLLVVRNKNVEFHYRYESWVQLASRRPLPRVDLSPVAAELNQSESSGGKWIFDGVDKITPRLHVEGSLETSLSPELIRARIGEHLRTKPAAWNPYD